MADLYAFDAQDVQRLRRLLNAYERGAIRVDEPDARFRVPDHTDGILGHVTTAIPSGQVGTAYLVKPDDTSPTPVLTDEDKIDGAGGVTLNVLAAFGSLPVGYYLLVQEPIQGYYIPANVGVSPFFAQITGQIGTGSFPTRYLYSFREVTQTTGSPGWQVVTGGRTGTTNAWERNGNCFVPLTANPLLSSGGQIVQMYSSAVAGDYEFDCSAERFSGVACGGGQTLASGAFTNLTVTAGGYDTDGYTTALLAPVTGYYRARCQVEMSLPSTVYGAITTTSFPSATFETYLLGPNQFELNCVGKLTAGSGVVFQVFQNSGGNVTVSNVIVTMNRIRT